MRVTHRYTAKYCHGFLCKRLCLLLLQVIVRLADGSPAPDVPVRIEIPGTSEPFIQGTTDQEGAVFHTFNINTAATITVEVSFPQTHKIYIYLFFCSLLTVSISWLQKGDCRRPAWEENNSTCFISKWQLPLHQSYQQAVLCEGCTYSNVQHREWPNWWVNILHGEPHQPDYHTVRAAVCHENNISLCLCCRSWAAAPWLNRDISNLAAQWNTTCR